MSGIFRDEVGWLWPLCESLHFVGLSLLIGAAGFFDLRLLGFMRGVPLRSVKRFMPWASDDVPERIPSDVTSHGDTEARRKPCGLPYLRASVANPRRERDRHDAPRSSFWPGGCRVC